MPSGVARVARVWLQWLQAGEPQERAWSDLGLGEVDVLGWKTGIGGAHWGRCPPRVPSKPEALVVLEPVGLAVSESPRAGAEGQLGWDRWAGVAGDLGLA